MSAATFKFYIREGLVAAGERVNQTQSVYGEPHVRRVRLVRALLETGGLSIAQARTVLATLDADEPLTETFAAAQHAISALPAELTASETATQHVAAAAAGAGWAYGDDNPGFELAASALEGIVAAGMPDPGAFLSAYAAAADTVAAADLAALAGAASPEEAAELMVVGTVLGDRLLVGLRRMAQQHHANARPTVATPGPGRTAQATSSTGPEHEETP